MNRKILIVVIFGLFLLMTPPVESFGWVSHKWLWNRSVAICSEQSLDCSWLKNYMDEGRDGSIAPDRDFGDARQGYHSCYADDCKSMRRAKEYYNKAYLDPSNLSKTAWYLGVSSHYFSDSNVPWHTIKGEDYEKCHRPWETFINKKFENNNTNWTYEITCTFEDGRIVYDNQTYEDMDEIARKLAYFLHDGQTLTYEQVKDPTTVITYPKGNNVTPIDWPKIPIDTPTNIFKKIIDFLKSLFSSA